MIEVFETKSHTADCSTGARTNRVSAGNGRAPASTKGCFTTNSDAMNNCGTEITKKSTGKVLVYGIMLLAFWIGGNSKAMGQSWTISAGYMDNVVATLTGSGNNRTLTITGTRYMCDFYDTQGQIMFGWDYNYRPPWYSYRTNIRTVEIGNGVKNIGDGAFEGCTNLDSVKIPCSVEKIGITAFMNCTSLRRIEIPFTTNWTTEIEGGAFYGCNNLAIKCRMFFYPTITLNSAYINGNQHPFAKYV